MTKIKKIKELADLFPYQNKDRVIEIVERGQNKRIKTFQKVMISDLQKTQEKELAQKVIHALNENTLLNERHLELLGNVANMQQIGILLNGLNLCATCAGFAIMYAKLDQMSAEINQQIQQLQNTVKHMHDIKVDFEFNKVLSEHMDMLDSQRKQQPYSEGKMRELVDNEYNVLMLLISSFQKDVSGDHSALIFSIFSMLAMFTVSLRSFDELYYFNNRQALGEEAAWHMAHDKWMSIYDILSSERFVEKIQDYGTFETNLSSLEVDIYYKSLLEQVVDMRDEIEDNQALIVAVGDAELFKQYKDMSAQQVVDSIEAAYRESGSDFNEKTVKTAYENAMRQMAIV